MKRYFLIKSLLLSLVVSSCLLAETRQIPQGYKEISCTIVPMTQKSEHISHPHIPGAKSSDPVRAARHQATSTNWAGYVAANNLASPAQNSVSAVFGSWIVPLIVPSNNNTYSTYWVGIDGYSSPTVEQIGTSHNFIDGVQQNYAWFEMYPGGSYAINGFPLNPGEIISASVQYSGNNTFTLTLYNDSRQVAYTVPTIYTQSSTAQRSSAEWIIEAPWSNGVLPLADFITAYRWGCSAIINGIWAPINNTSWPNLSLEMVTNHGAPKAFPSATLQDNGSFFVTWAHQ